MVSDWLAQAPASAASPTTRYVVPGCMVPRVRVHVRATFATLLLGAQVRGGVPSQAAPRPGRKFQWPIVLQPYGRCQRRDGLDTQIRHNGKLLWASPGPVRGRANAEPEVIRASRAMRGVHPSASLACPSDNRGIK